MKVEAGIGIAISGVSRIQFHHLFRIFLAGVAVGNLPIVAVHDSDQVASGIWRLGERKQYRSRQDDHQTLIGQRSQPPNSK